MQYLSVTLLALAATAANAVGPDPTPTNDCTPTDRQGPYPSIVVPTPLPVLPTRYCGVDWAHSNMCRENKTVCKDDTDEECPTGEHCFVNITNVCTVPLENNVSVKVYQKCQNASHVALTFDDGPNNYSTPVILDYLKANNIQATFFVLGNMVDCNPEVLRRTIAENHSIGTHTYTHPHLSTLTNVEIVKEMQDVHDAVEDALNMDVNFTYMRPPYGDADERVIAVLGEMGYRHIIKWALDSDDWNTTDATEADIQSKWEAYAENKCYDNYYCDADANTTGAIILHHDIYMTTANAIPEVVPILLNLNKTFVSVPECIGMPDNSFAPRN